MAMTAGIRLGDPPAANGTELADRFVRDLLGIGQLSAIPTVTARYAIIRLGAALGVLDRYGSDPFNPGTFVYTSTVIRQAIEAAARQLTSTLPRRGHWALRYSEPANPETLLRRATVVPIIDLNRAPPEELAKLEGIGRVTAERLVAARDERWFENTSDARKRAKIDVGAWRKAAPFLRASRYAPLPAVPAVDDRPLQALIAGLRQGTVQWPELQQTGHPQADAVNALILCCERAGTPVNTPQYWSPSPARLRAGVRALRARPGGSGAAVDGRVALVLGGSYPSLLDELLAQARSSVRVTMFFFSFEAPSVGQHILERLSTARDRGVDVKLILGIDLPGDVHGAAAVNAPAISALTGAGLTVRTAWPEVALHEKAVVIDERRCLVGSHNWTASAFYRYDETSLLLGSAALGQQLARRFDDRWAMLAPDEATRRIPLSALELVGAPMAARLGRAGVRSGADLDVDEARLAELGVEAGVPRERLAFVARVASLMLALRISELAAATLVAAEIDTVARVRATPKATLRELFEHPAVEPPPPLSTRRVFSGIAGQLGDS